jgi:hypothetical protein
VAPGKGVLRDPPLEHFLLKWFGPRNARPLQSCQPVRNANLVRRGRNVHLESRNAAPGWSRKRRWKQRIAVGYFAMR